jgi:uncharacterized membrane protein
MIRTGFVRGFGVGFGFPLWGAIVGFVLFFLLIAVLVWLVIVLSRPRRFGPMGPYAYRHPYQSPALHELDLAYARGQLSREEYLRRRADLSWAGYPGGPPTPGGTPGDTPQGPAPQP